MRKTLQIYQICPELIGFIANNLFLLKFGFSVVERMISLERNFEKKHWRPNRMVLDLFEKPKQTYDFTQKITKKYSEKSL